MQQGSYRCLNTPQVVSGRQAAPLRLYGPSSAQADPGAFSAVAELPVHGGLGSDNVQYSLTGSAILSSPLISFIRLCRNVQVRSVSLPSCFPSHTSLLRSRPITLRRRASMAPNPYLKAVTGSANPPTPKKDKAPKKAKSVQFDAPAAAAAQTSEDAALRAEILAMGGDEEDLQLLQGVDSDSEVEGEVEAEQPKKKGGKQADGQVDVSCGTG